VDEHATPSAAMTTELFVTEDDRQSTVSLTSTQPEETQDEYAVEKILCEQTSEGEERRYLG